MYLKEFRQIRNYMFLMEQETNIWLYQGGVIALKK